ncbi:MAG: selenocysteine-specific translation elongation factor [Chloroflexota bacterium]
MRVVGTAGHVDHGKSTLIASLTGINPDRLKEEQEREMTIDLGFAWLTLPNGEDIGIIDVPGHRDFIENMLAGVGGIDAALLVVAADEGIMPQTREHLAILDLLQIQAGLIVLTKVDLVEDSEWLDLIETEVRELLTGTILEAAPILRVSARNKSGLAELVAALGSLLERQSPRLDLGRPRLPIDRVFSMPGFGTVVTGTLTDGQLKIGDEVTIMPGGIKGRIRGLQTHKKKEDVATPGSRTAVNISGVNHEELQRGNVVTLVGHYKPSQRIDVQIRLLPDISMPIKHGTEVKIFLGTTETIAKVRLLGTEVLNSSQEGWLQLELRHPVVSVRGDRYILRRPSPGETLGGGTVIDPHPKRRHKRFDASVIKALSSTSGGSPIEVMLQASLAMGPASIKDIVQKAQLDSDTSSSALDELISTGQLIPIEVGPITNKSDILVVSASQWEDISSQVNKVIDSYHRTYPLRKGMPREELKSRLKIAPRVFNGVIRKLSAEKAVVEMGSLIAAPGYKIIFSLDQQGLINRLLDRFASSPYSPPTIKECQTEITEDLLDALVELGELIAVSSEVIFKMQDYNAMVATVREIIEKQGQITLAEVRDAFNTSRRYAQALLEHLDAIGMTYRHGDYRKIRKQS